MGVLVAEYLKKVPIFWVHKVYWLGLSIDFIASIFVVTGFLEQGLWLIKSTLMIILTIYSLWIRKQDDPDFENAGFF